MKECDACGKLRGDLRPFGEIRACFLCRVEWQRRRRVWSVDLKRYATQAEIEALGAWEDREAALADEYQAEAKAMADDLASEEEFWRDELGRAEPPTDTLH